MLIFNIQRFAGDKTERATPQRRREAKRDGKTARSADLTSAAALTAVLIGLKMFGGRVWEMWKNDMTFMLTNVNSVAITQKQVIGIGTKFIWTIISILTPLLAIAMISGFVVAFSQVGPSFTPKTIIPDLTRLNPISGLQRLWSARTLMEAVKSVLKLVLVGSVAYLSVHSIEPQLVSLVEVGLTALPSILGRIVFQMGIQICVLMLGLSVLDFLFQKFEFEKSIRMSKQDIKDEMKRFEGNPLVKAKIRQRGRALAFRRMMQEVPKADVIITNPTHFSIAVLYDSKTMKAPTVIAKGQDIMALKIRESAATAGVPLVENRVLAQNLYKSVDIGEQVPIELFQAVAQVLAYVYRIRSIGNT